MFGKVTQLYILFNAAQCWQSYNKANWSHIARTFYYMLLIEWTPSTCIAIIHKHPATKGGCLHSLDWTTGQGFFHFYTPLTGCTWLMHDIYYYTYVQLYIHKYIA